MTRRAAAVLCSTVLTVAGLVPVVSAASTVEAAVPSQEQWAADVNRAMAGSRVYLNRRAAAGGRSLAVNFDIDNTSLASHYEPGAPVPVVLRFADHAEALGVTLLFNTGRVRGDGAQVRAVRQLRRAGFAATEVCGRTSGSEGLAESKQRCRRHFVGKGYTLVANVGNRGSDFVGGDYEEAFRLPSYGHRLD